MTQRAIYLLAIRRIFDEFRNEQSRNRKHEGRTRGPASTLMETSGTNCGSGTLEAYFDAIVCITTLDSRPAASLTSISCQSPGSPQICSTIMPAKFCAFAPLVEGCSSAFHFSKYQWPQILAGFPSPVCGWAGQFCGRAHPSIADFE